MASLNARSLGLVPTMSFGFYNIQCGLFALPLSGDAEHGADGICHLTTFADHPSHVFAGHGQLQTDTITTPKFPDYYLLRVIHQRFRNVFDEFLHRSTEITIQEEIQACSPKQVPAGTRRLVLPRLDRGAPFGCGLGGFLHQILHRLTLLEAFVALQEPAALENLSHRLRRQSTV